MCGIIGYTGNNNAKDIAISGLKTLEYRGYDSAGIAISKKNNVQLYKASGKIANLENLINDKNIEATTAIGHTRWATHGKPNVENAHPHKCGKTTLVHNGIIENYQVLKEELLSKDIILQSNTDTEVACAYIEEIRKNNPSMNKIEMIQHACTHFVGSYAFGILFDDEPETIYTAKLNSPLIIGIGDNENFIASDISAFLKFTKYYTILEDHQYAKITKSHITLYNDHLKELPIQKKEATFEITNYQKNGYEHFMLKEIHEQPQVIFEVLQRYFEKKEHNYDKINFSKIKDIHIVACGSAMHAGYIGKYLLETYANIATYVEVASEYRYKKHVCDSNTLVIVISQSGETADTIAALNIAKQNGCMTLGIVNAVGCTISRMVDINFYTHAGPEIAVATTKGYTTQVATLIALTLQAMKQKNIIHPTSNTISDDYRNLNTLLKNIIHQDTQYIKIAESLKDKENLFFIGRGIDYSISMEGSLKLKEISYIHSESYPAGELKHGTISLIEEGTPIIAIATNEELLEKTISNIKETKARGAFVIFITTENLKSLLTDKFYDICLTLPDTNVFFQSLTVSIALQLISYHTAKLRGCDIDQPKNLAKSVTVE